MSSIRDKAWWVVCGSGKTLDVCFSMLNVAIGSRNENALLVFERLLERGAVDHPRSASFGLRAVGTNDGEVILHRVGNEQATTAFDLVVWTHDEKLSCCGRHTPDVLLSHADPTILTDKVDDLWENRIVPFNRSLAALRPKHRRGPAVMVGPDPSWPMTAARIAERLVGKVPSIVRVDHIGSTAIPGLHAKNVIDLQVGVSDFEDLDCVSERLSQAGYPAVPGKWWDTPTSYQPDPLQWVKLLHVNSDPGQDVNIHVRVIGTAGWFFTLSFRDWLRSHTEHMSQYAEEKQRIAAKHANDVNTMNYATEKKLWFREYVEPQLYAWVERSDWRPDPREKLDLETCCPATVAHYSLPEPNTVTAPELSPTATRLPSWPQTIADVG
jgi:GrpB-like predicted nucleotidyltransferase (UPF0157 family)